METTRMGYPSVPEWCMRRMSFPNIIRSKDSTYSGEMCYRGEDSTRTLVRVLRM